MQTISGLCLWPVEKVRMAARREGAVNGQKEDASGLQHLRTHSPAIMLPGLLTTMGIVTTASWELLDPFVRQVM